MACIHESWAPWLLALAIILTVLGLIIFYMVSGPNRYPRDRVPVFVIRYSAFERFNHWMTATSFIVSH